MTDYKSMYYHLAGRTATAVDVLEATISILEANATAMKNAMEATTTAMKDAVVSLSLLKDKLKTAQQITEDMFVNADDESNI